jgi:hypothetical protein
MGQSAKGAARAPATSTRSGASRKLLTRKALERSPAPAGEPLEASFPQAASEEGPDAPSDVHSTSSSAPTAAPAPQPPTPAAWSSEEEAGFQALLARRKAAGYQRRGRDVSGQVLRPGMIKPNPETIVATIVALVAERGELSRRELLELMSTASFPHRKAQPSDKGWCQGYVAGALRSGFLAFANEPSTVAAKEG